jgi:preprotein translocase subunit YajC
MDLPRFSVAEPVLVALDVAPAASGSSLMSNLVPIVMMVAIFYFLLIRPQQQERKQHDALLASLKKGDRVVTASGLHGVVHEDLGELLLIEIATNVRVTVDRSSIKSRPSADGAAAAKG